MASTDLNAKRETLKARAAAYHERGFNCAQCVVCSFAPEIALDADTAFRLAEGLGLGMGGMSETCGALSGAVMVLGQLVSRGPLDPTTKAATYRLARDAASRFQQLTGSTICGTIKGVGSSSAPLRSCPECIENAIDILTDLISQKHRSDLAI
ncbi:C_GCAxxG_C_C family protein [Coriobacterium glomerans PW2]|uniref:C_GCAxxG_C_C family protein n=1 Tax=Coriobacterium glomerans (strain ATCC 49209 / DSM 20642 / JCM 10262 / PW2) TaxID=700015 RepID=F2NBU0_CORGP|nr:C-GCAxxG-C-C family protein [Coriobacterium glomerans]AEB06899.1 C_GCAxxG_C_C family protein [Coriobacterium glomerans PW2]